MRLRVVRDKKSKLISNGHINLSEACARANQTGFFALQERVHPESYDGNDTNIDSRQLFFGGRRIDLACKLQNVEDLAARAVNEPEPAVGGPEPAAD